MQCGEAPGASERDRARIPAVVAAVGRGWGRQEDCILTCLRAPSRIAKGILTNAIGQVDRTVWSTCVEAALEYVRMERDLHPGPTASNIMLAAAEGTHESQLAFRWNDEQQVPARAYGRACARFESGSWFCTVRLFLPGLCGCLDHEVPGPSAA